MMRGVCGLTATPRNGESPIGLPFKHAIEPTVRRAFDSWRADLHVILRVEMRAGVIRRTGRMNDGQLALIVNILERRQRGVQRIKTIEIDGAFFTRSRLGDGDARPKRIVSAVFEGDDDI